MQRTTIINNVMLLAYAIGWAGAIVLMVQGGFVNRDGINWPNVATIVFCLIAIGACAMIVRENLTFGKRFGSST
jgi:hypothetical protein